MADAQSHGRDTEHRRDSILMAKSLLVAHLKRKDDELYPPLIEAAKSDNVVHDALEFFREYMDSVSKATFEFIEKYENSSSAEGFSDDLMKLQSLLWTRVQKEEFVVYRIFDRLTGAAGDTEDVPTENKDDADPAIGGITEFLSHQDFDLQAQLGGQNAIFSYSGYLTEDILTSASVSIKQALTMLNAETRIKSRLIYIFIELAQNIIRYSANVLSDPEGNSDALRHGSLMVGVSHGRYFARSNNLVAEHDVQRLTDYLQLIQNLDEAALKALYKKTLRGEIPEGSKGAHVGFIEMVRRADSGFEFEFVKIGAGKTNFCVTAFV